MRAEPLQHRWGQIQEQRARVWTEQGRSVASWSEPRDGASTRAPTLRIPLQGGRSVQRSLCGDATPFQDQVLSFSFLRSWARWVSDHQLQNLSSHSFPKAICNIRIKLVFSSKLMYYKQSGSSVALQTKYLFLKGGGGVVCEIIHPAGQRVLPSVGARACRPAGGRQALPRPLCQLMRNLPPGLTSHCSASTPPDFCP